MIWKLLQNQDLQQRYYDWIVKIMNYQGKMQILPVDFEQPWWTILWIQKGRIVAIFIAQVIWTLQWVLLPIFIAWAIESRNYGYLLGIILVRVVSVYLVTWIFYQNAILQLQAMQGIYVNAITTLLQVDPIHHATKSTGQIIAKVERGSDAFEDILDIITFEVLNIGIGLISVLIVFFIFSWQLGLVVLGFFVLIIGLSMGMSIFHANAFESRIIELEDQIQATGTESIYQAAFIRSVFGTPEQITKNRKFNLDGMYQIGSGWHAQGQIFNFTLVIYFCSLGFVGCFLIWQVELGQISVAQAVALVGTYMLGTGEIVAIGEKTKRFTRSFAAITDLFSFIRGFGQQTYPVLEESPTLGLPLSQK